MIRVESKKKEQTPNNSKLKLANKKKYRLSRATFSNLLKHLRTQMVKTMNEHIIEINLKGISWNIVWDIGWHGLGGRCNLRLSYPKYIPCSSNIPEEHGAIEIYNNNKNFQCSRLCQLTPLIRVDIEMAQLGMISTSMESDMRGREPIAEAN